MSGRVAKLPRIRPVGGADLVPNNEWARSDKQCSAQVVDQVSTSNGEVSTTATHQFADQRCERSDLSEDVR